MVIAAYLPPADRKAVRRPLESGAYYRCFIEGFSPIAQPLNSPHESRREFKRETGQVEAFEEMRRRLQRPPIRTLFSDYADTEIHIDASSVRLRAVLEDRIDVLEGVISNPCRSLSKAEANYSTTEKECLDIM